MVMIKWKFGLLITGTESGAAMCGLENILPSKEDAFIFQIDQDGNAGWGKVYGKRTHVLLGRSLQH